MQGRRVRVLSAELANRIAAGEVVERPASVVKELAENAVDAGARRVHVRLEQAGKALVAVEDDGTGMGREDAVLALERHATSKIAVAEDLDAISTLGFRGEALPSIASVSRFRLLTRTAGEAAGVEVTVEGGKVAGVRAAGAPKGTTVEVRDLFYNVPARRKFLKTDATELRAAVEVVTHLALVHSSVGFDLRSDGRVLLAVPPGQAPEDRVAEVVGAEAPGGLQWARWQGEGRSFALAAAAPHEGRGQRRGLRLFVNGRSVQDRLLARAVLEGYRGLLEPGRFPCALLWLHLPPDEVDVNVHPAKREVRFRDEGQVFRWVLGRTAEALAAASWGRRPANRVSGESTGPTRGEEPRAQRPEIGRVADALASYAGREAARVPVPRWSPAPSPRAALPLEGPRGEAPLRRFGGLRHLGAFDATYLLFEDEDSRDLVLLDQHAAHERVLYEGLLADRTAGPRTQALLFPLTLECSAAELAAYGERRALLAGLGFRVEEFGPTALAVAETPAGFPAAAVEAAIRDVLEDQELGPGEPERRREAAARRLACAGAVKAKKALLPSEARELLARLEGLRHPTHCPHGRPLLVRLSRAEVEGMFHRR